MENVIRNTIEMPVFDRIRAASNEKVNEQILWQIRKNLEQHSHSPESIEKRLAELDREWDIDRALMAGFSLGAMAGVFAGAFFHRKWLWLSALQLPVIFAHAAHGWSPSLPFLRSLGYRSRQEIEVEKMELRKAGAQHYQGRPRYSPGE